MLFLVETSRIPGVYNWDLWKLENQDGDMVNGVNTTCGGLTALVRAA